MSKTPPRGQKRVAGMTDRWSTLVTYFPFENCRAGPRNKISAKQLSFKVCFEAIYCVVPGTCSWKGDVLTGIFDKVFLQILPRLRLSRIGFRDRAKLLFSSTCSEGMRKRVNKPICGPEAGSPLMCSVGDRKRIARKLSIKWPKGCKPNHAFRLLSLIHI